MKLARYTIDGRTTIGAVVNDCVIEIAALDPAAPGTIRELLALGPAGRARIAHALLAAPKGTPLAKVKLEAPIPDAQKYMAIGMNYHDHAEESRKAGVPAEMHIYRRGAHGVGLASGIPGTSTWPDRLKDWMKNSGLLTAKKTGP